MLSRKNHKSVSALDVAAYILKQKGPMTAMKLQKLVYYSQAWSLAWGTGPLFSEDVEAWANGPVCPELYQVHKGHYWVDSCSGGVADRLSTSQKEGIDAVLELYGNKSPDWLSALTHKEAPWLDARDGLLPGERGSRVITPAAMAEYYESLL